MSNDLSPLWISDNLKAARYEYNRAYKAYQSLSNKSTSYARGIERVLEIKEKVVALWDAAAEECSREQTQRITGQVSPSKELLFTHPSWCDCPRCDGSNGDL